MSYIGNREWKPRPALILTTPPLHSTEYAPLPASTDTGFLGQMSPVPAAGTGHKVYRKYENDGRAVNRERVNPTFRLSGETFDCVTKTQNATQVQYTDIHVLLSQCGVCELIIFICLFQLCYNVGLNYCEHDAHKECILSTLLMYSGRQDKSLRMTVDCRKDAIDCGDIILKERCQRPTPACCLTQWPCQCAQQLDRTSAGSTSHRRASRFRTTTTNSSRCPSRPTPSSISFNPRHL